MVILKTFFRFKIIGSENVPQEGGTIVVTNHVSYLDPLVVGCGIKKRQATYIARRDLFKIPLVGLFVRQFSFPVDRDSPQPSTIKEAVGRLRRGELIVMFPEGARSKDGTILEAKRGVSVIATMARAIIVPAFIEGTHRALPVGAGFIKPAKITVIFGKPIEIEYEKAGKHFQEKLGNDIMEAIRRLKK